jgi:hypothetical protein
MAMGSGGSEIHATLGDDTYILGDGADTVVYSSLLQSDGSESGFTDTIDGFDTELDKIDISSLVDGLWGYGMEGETLSIDVDNDASSDLVIMLIGAPDLTIANFVV